MSSQFGVIGLGVMGKNIALNIADKGFSTSVFNRTYARTTEFLQESPHENISGYDSIEAFVASLEAPRKILLMVKAGFPVDATIEALLPLLQSGDIIIDGGNAHWQNSIARENKLQQEGVHFIGSGISGGEEGARHGPSLMPGGDKDAYEMIRPIWEAIAAKDFGGQPCTTYVGASSSGNFVKMVHNGIEYAMMQSIAEVYDLLRNAGNTPKQIRSTFAQLNQGHLKSFLLEITEDIFSHKDPQNPDTYLIDVISDRAKSKGTGGWTVQSCIDLGVPVPSISAALMARQISAREWRFPDVQTFASSSSNDTNPNTEGLESMLYLSFLGSYLQGVDGIIAASNEYKWGVDISEVLRIWQGGCIIRSVMLEPISDVMAGTKDMSIFAVEKHLANIHQIMQNNPSVPLPVGHSIFDYFSALTREQLSTNLIQAQRDYFGAHTFQRTDDLTGTSYHHDWN